MVVVPLNVTAAPVVALRPVVGVHTYVAAPAAVIVVVLPEHIAAEPGVAVTVGVVLTAIAHVAVATHPAALVPVTV